MRKIAIIGAGQAGLLLGFALIEAGYRVSLYTDRDAEAVLHGPLPNTAAVFETQLAYERSLGLNFWDDDAPRGEGLAIDFRSPEGEVGMQLVGSFGEHQALSLDFRTKFHQWQAEYGRRGGLIQISSVRRGDVDEIAAQHDLTLVAGGKGEIVRMFARDDERSHFTAPPRRLAGGIFVGPGLIGDRPWPELDFRPFRFHFITGVGESFSMPFFSHSRGECRAVLFEALPGGPMDAAGDIADADGMAAYVHTMMQRFMPEEAPHYADAELVDPRAWLRGGFTPEVRHPIAKLDSGKPVLGIGDAVVLNDPAGGQGANNATRMVQHYIRRIIEHGSAEFDEAWMQDVFDTYWESTGRDTVDYTTALLEPPSAELMSILVAGAGDFGVASAFAQTLDQPWVLQRAVENEDTASKFVAEHHRAVAAGA